MNLLDSIDFDILVADEVRNIAPSGIRRYVWDSLCIQEIRPRSHLEHKLLLAAMPHNGYQASFSALLELPDKQCRLHMFEVDYLDKKKQAHTWLKEHVCFADNLPLKRQVGDCYGCCSSAHPPNK